MSGKFGKSIKLINSFQKLNKQNRSSEFVWRINFQEQKLQKIILKISSTALFLFFKKIFYETLQSPSRQFFFLIYFQLTVNSSLTLSQYNQSLENVFSQMLAIKIRKLVAENISISLLPIVSAKKSLDLLSLLLFPLPPTYECILSSSDEIISGKINKALLMSIYPSELRREE